MKYSFIILFTLFTANIFSQAPVSVVYDPRLEAVNLKEILVEKEALETSVKIKSCIEEQKKTIDETLDFWEKADNALTTVNSKLDEVIYAKSAAQRVINIVDYHSKYISNLDGFSSLDPGEISKAYAELNTLLSHSRALLRQAKNILKSDFFKMDDGQRMEILMKIDDDLKNTQSLLSQTYYIYYKINFNRTFANMY